MPQGNVIIFEVRLFYYSWVTILILNFYRNEECLVRKESRRYNGCYLILAGNSKKELRKYIGCERKREREERERESCKTRVDFIYFYRFFFFFFHSMPES